MRTRGQSGVESGLRHLSFFCLLLMPSAAVTAVPAYQPVAMPIGNGADPLASGAARMVGAILEYTRWPAEHPVIRLCVVGATRHAGRLDEASPPHGARIDLSPLSDPTEPARNRCDALYIGQLASVPLRRLIGDMRGKPVVTIAEDDPDCRSGAMFCLIFTPQTLSFQLNIDAVSRSAVRIDPRVLRMSKGGY